MTIARLEKNAFTVGNFNRTTYFRGIEFNHNYVIQSNLIVIIIQTKYFSILKQIIITKKSLENLTIDLLTLSITEII